jgi:hypothetical protein
MADYVPECMHHHANDKAVVRPPASVLGWRREREGAVELTQKATIQRLRLIDRSLIIAARLMSKLGAKSDLESTSAGGGPPHAHSD